MLIGRDEQEERRHDIESRRRLDERAAGDSRQSLFGVTTRKLKVD